MELKSDLKSLRSSDSVKESKIDSVNKAILDITKEIWSSSTSFQAIKEIAGTSADKLGLPKLELASSTSGEGKALDKQSLSKKAAEPKVETKTAIQETVAAKAVDYASNVYTVDYASHVGTTSRALTRTANTELSSADVRMLFQSNLRRLDRDADGFVSEDEIDAAIVDPSIQGRDAQLVAALKCHQSDLEELSNDEWGDEDDGVTLADIVEFDRQQAEAATGERIKAFGQSHFNQLDRDRDGYIEQSELNVSRLSTAFTAAERQIISDMASRVGDIEEVSNDEWGDEDDGITRNDLADYCPSEQQELIGDVVRTMGSTRQAIDRSNRDLYSTPNPLDSITPAAIRQGPIGDCYFLAALGSVADMDPQAIHNMIQDNNDGTYTVTFPGAADHPITVTAPTDAELALYNHGTPNGTWASVMEKAYGAYCNEHFYNRSPLNLGGSDVAQEGADGGSVRAAGLRILTGGGVDDDDNLWTSYTTMDAKLSQAFAEGRPVTAYAIRGDSDYNISSLHEYSVLDYDSATRTITLRNPWGHGEPNNAFGTSRDGANDGVFTMTLEEFNEAFAGLSYAERAA